jgi:uncharacterized protein YfaP (DUF2135 family)
MLFLKREIKGRIRRKSEKNTLIEKVVEGEQRPLQLHRPKERKKHPYRKGGGRRSVKIKGK